MQELNNLAKKVKSLRVTKGITRRVLMKKSGLSDSTIRRIEQCKDKKYNPHLDTLAYLACGLGTTLSELVAQPIRAMRRQAVGSNASYRATA